MFRTAAPGHVGNKYVDEVEGVSEGTYRIEEDANITQEELVKAVEAAGLSVESSPGTVEDQLAEAMQKLVAEGSKFLGELFFLDSYRALSAWDRANPDNYFAGLCLNDGDHDIVVANFPDLVPHLRAKKATYNEGISGSKSAFDVTNWVVATNVGTLTFADQTAEKALLADYAEDNLVHGNFTDYRSVTLASAIGNIPAGEYALTGIDASARTITFAVTASDGSGGVTTTVEFYKHRIPGTTTTARVFERPGGVLVAANDADGECIAGMRRRDRANSIDQVDSLINSGSGYSVNVPDDGSYSPILTLSAGGSTRNIKFAKKGLTTNPRALVGHLYLWGKSYVA